MPIVRSKEHYKYLVVNTDDIIKHGFEKACILGNLDRFEVIYSSEEIHEGFPHIEKGKFYELLQELIQDVFATREERGQNEDRT